MNKKNENVVNSHKNKKVKDEAEHTFYHNDKEYLEEYFQVLDLIDEEKTLKLDEEEPSKIASIKRKREKKLKDIQKKLELSHKQGRTFAWEELAKKYQLNNTEQKIILFLLYRYFNDEQGTTGRTILENVTETRLEMMRSRNLLLEKGKLREYNIIQAEEDLEDRNLLDSFFQMSENMISHLLGDHTAVLDIQSNNSEKDYHSYLQIYFSLVKALQEKLSILTVLQEESHSKSQWNAYLKKDQSNELESIKQNIKQMQATLKEFEPFYDTYPLEQIAKKYNLTDEEKLILVILMHDSITISDEPFGLEGKKIIALLSESESEKITKRALLYQENPLCSNHLVEIKKYSTGQNILDCDYYIPEKELRVLLGTIPNTLEEDTTLFTVVSPRFTFDDVILGQKQKQAIEIVLSQQLHHDLIFDVWGFGEKIPYGNSLSMLFSGKPGTGKTMMAEAIAHKLNKPLLVANYAQIQNMYVGETEKRITNIFRLAQEREGVLLWDEADAMFYTRDMTTQSWEARDINLILQELERFSGVVILTTNRTISLDHALERRLTLKVNFEMPDAEQREKIWKSLIPKQAPLSPDIHFHDIAVKYEISGGLIKNAILQAAQYAVWKSSPMITEEDIIYGIKTQLENSWTNNNKMGFSR